jgi:solute carrier family 25 (mitochondrial oxoglutarate transporter), member 11
MLKKRAEKLDAEVTMFQRSIAALSAGGLGAVIGNPTEVGLVRMQSNGMKAVSQRENYHSVFDALARITKGEGIAALWSGSSPTIIKAMATNFRQLATFSQAKPLLGNVEGLSEQTRTVSASAIAGFFAAVCSLPFDFVKIQITKSREGRK